MTYESKTTSNGHIEIRDSGVPGWYGLFVNGRLVDQSADYNYIKNRYYYF